MRQLASIQKVLDIQPIPGADAIEVLTVLGWKVVAKKGEFKVGDLVVYCEVDSILPEEPEYEFLRKAHFRIKTIRLKGQVSQGIVFPVCETLAEKHLPLCEQFGSPLPEGTDLTETLGITKYEVYVPAQLAGERKGNFPDWLHKTDETRIQAVPAVLYRHQQKKFYVTEKVDGSSMTVYLKNGEFGVCSRNFDMKETEGNSFWKTARALELERFLGFLSFRSDPYTYGLTNIALQGELVGPGVQGNKYKLDKLNFFIFNVFDIDKGQHLDFKEFKQFVDYAHLTTVPVVNEEYTLPITIDELVEFSKGKSILNKDVHREGIVLRPHVNEYDEDLRGRLSFKCVNPDFLIKYSDD